MTDRHTGLLAIWSTIEAHNETDYLHWLTREHVFERVGVPGFRSGRVFKRRASKPSEYLMLYELDTANVMSSTGYLSRLNDPSEWTQRIMPNLMRFRRGGGSVVLKGGHVGGYGSHIAIARFEDIMPDELTGSTGQELIDALARLDWVVTVQAMTVQTDGTSIATREKSMRRSQEGAFCGLLVIEALDHASLDNAITHATRVLPTTEGKFELFDAIFSCHKP
ncbi:DUF4286 family protein [Caballeronia sp. GAFFF2]|uniref:DUF4286 family protein n=1 Tax=Caballeronia sp. GAFFF2 TaxID=2921741 RepID=UPI0020279369|nr:DUF4286 family protein [Caballeronia sp. GAFFF2]